MVSLFSGPFSIYFYYLIPFIFTFSLVFGVLTISNIFNKQKNVNVMIALAISLFATISEEYVSILYSWLPYLCVLFIVIFFVVMLKNIFIKKDSEQNWPILITIAILFLVLMTIYPSIPLPSGSFISSQDVLLVIGITFVVLILIVGSKVNWPGTQNE
ncbi:MAG: hypothetical protein DRP10_03780 [Candidatus Aenigmatarchaeota archaeon]|nr:MAG: hypothetical protein DRP10_03780 [Candidatus Aenigmarchaeota archaeon]